MSGAQDNAGTPGGQESQVSSVESQVEESLLDTLRFDPFADASPAAKKEVGATASPSSAPPRSAPAQAAPGQPQPSPEGAPGTAPTSPTTAAAPADAGLAAAADRLSAAADRLQAPQGQGQPGKPPGQDDIPDYIFDIPPQLLNGLNSDDPGQRQAAVQHLVAGTARAVHTNVVKMMAEVRSALPQLVASQLASHTYRENVRRDFYSKFPMLDNPHLAPTVASVSSQVMAEVAQAGGRPAWSPQLAQQIADRVFALIPGLRPAAPAAPAAPPAAPPNQPPHIFSPGSRPSAGNNLQAEIENTLFGN